MAADLDITHALCRAMVSEGLSLVRACEKLGQDRSVVYDWLAEDQAFADRYARADIVRAELHAARIEQIADDVLAKRISPEAGRVAIDALKWTASKLHSRKYGDRLDVTASNTQHVIVRHVLHTREPTPLELEPVEVQLIGKK